MYAPPEQLYDTAVLDRAAYRRAGDLYLFGSMIFFFVTGQPITPQIVSLLHVDHRPGVWSGKFEDVLPYWRDAYGRVVGDFKATLKSDVGAARTELLASTVELLKCATEPDVRHRGHPSARRSLNTSPYDMQRFVSAFDLLATKLETSTARCNAATTERRAS